MKWLLFLPALVGAAGQTQVSVTAPVSGNGPVITQTQSPGTYQRTELDESVNGRMIPRERVEERVIRQDASGKVVERTVRRYSSANDPGSVEKTLSEETRQPGGGVIVRSSTYRSDINGGMQLTERTVTETTKTASGERSETVIQRPGINDSLQMAEKRTRLREGKDDQYRETESIYRQGENGLYEAVRRTTEQVDQKGSRSSTQVEYEIGSDGRLDLHGQTVTKTVKRPDGSEVSEIDYYAKSSPGIASSADSKLALKERDVVEKRPGPDGSVRETTLAQRPTISDPNVLGTQRVVSERVCRGDCGETKQ